MDQEKVRYEEIAETYSKAIRKAIWELDAMNYGNARKALEKGLDDADFLFNGEKPYKFY